MSNATTTSGGGAGGESAYNGNVASLVAGSATFSGVEPEIEINYTSPSEGVDNVTSTGTNTVSGSKTSQLDVKTDLVTVQNVYCKVSHATACVSGTSGGTITSDTVKFTSISSSNASVSVLNYEIMMDDSEGFYASGEQNLHLAPLNIEGTFTRPNRAVCVFSKDEDIPVKITMAGSAGLPGHSSNPSGEGGEGGKCVFTYTLKKNVEYIFKLGVSGNPTGSLSSVAGVFGGAGAFFYEQGRLLVACGGGGGGGTREIERGGAGGGGNVAGGNGDGSGSGAGAATFQVGALPSTATLPQSGAPFNGGTVESCTTGVYWRNQGVDPCSAMTGNQQFRTFQGNVVVSSASIQRGYKSGGTFTVSDGSYYGYRNNGGQNPINGIAGGAGVRGGTASSQATAGGGGGAGYSNGSVTMVSEQQGGNPTNRAYAEIELNI
tara:strand:+ start:10577 stop:11878 length:1302 start_codon:yes stop_codon:yes gene_type:complete